MYKKTGGAADGAGESYECKMLALVLLRMLETGLEFQLASNMEAAGKFDDIVLRHRKDPDDQWDVSYVQLKHKKDKNKFITKVDLLGISGDFSLVKYCESYDTMKLAGMKDLHAFGNFHQHNISLFTNASIDSSFIDVLESDPLLSTGGKVVSFKAGGEVYRGLCEWVDFKEALTELHGQVEGKSGEEGTKIKDALEGVKYNNKAVTSWRDELLKSPTLVKLKDVLKKLAPVSDKPTYSSFLAKLQVYTNQAHESQLNDKIKEQLAKVWNVREHPSTTIMLHSLQSSVKSWWLKSNVYLTQDSLLWLDIVKCQTELMSKSTIEGLTKTGAEFESESLRVLHEAIPPDGIVNVRVNSRTEASSLRVHQALAEFRADDPILHVNVQAFLEREADVLAAWTTRWCRVLVLECDKELSEIDAKRISCEIFRIFGGEHNDKLLVLIAPESHLMHVQLQALNKQTGLTWQHRCYKRFDDHCKWKDMTDAGKASILSACTVNMQGSEHKLEELLSDQDKARLGKVADLEVISQLLTGVTCGKALAEEAANFIERRLMQSSAGEPFAVISVLRVEDKVVLIEAEAGMGKSTLMTHLANRAKTEDPKAWIVHIKLNDCSEYLAKMRKNELNEDGARNFLNHCALSPGNDLETFMFQTLEGKLFVFLDGVDEVCPTYQQQVFTLLGFIKGFKFAKLWVASRPFLEKQLEALLGVKALHLDPFSDEEQTECFKHSWKTSQFFDASCNESTDTLRTLLANLPERDRDILGVPLIAAMVAKVFHSSKGELVKNNRLNKTVLYKMYVEQRLKILYLEKMKTENPHGAVNISMEADLRERSQRGLCLAALRALFGRVEIGHLTFGKHVNFDKDLAKFLEGGKQTTGIIDYVVNGTPVFTHHCLPEYFAALWIRDNLERNKEFAERILTTPANKLIGEMLNQLLCEGHSLHCAVLNRDVQETERLLTARPESSDVDALDKGGRTALHLAVLLSGTDRHEDFIAIVEALIQRHRARVDIADSITGWTPVQYAEQVRSWKVLDIFLHNGIKSNYAWRQPDDDALLDAARDASVRVVRYLAEDRGGDLRCRGRRDETVAHRAAEGGNVETLEYFADKGLPLCDRDENDSTALHYTTFHDQVHVVDFLLQRGVDIDAVNIRGMTALHEAAERGDTKVIAYFAENRAGDLHRRGPFCKTMVHIAAEWGHVETLEYLAGKGLSLHDKDKNDSTALHYTTLHDHVQVAEFLLHRGVDAKAVNVRGMTALHEAAERGANKVIACLIENHGGDLQGRGPFGKTMVHIAAEWGHVATLEYLAGKGLSLHDKDKHNSTALHYTTFHDHVHVAEFLLKKGVDLKAVNVRGMSAYQEAVERRAYGVMAVLGREAQGSRLVRSHEV